MKTRLILFLVLFTGAHLTTASGAFADDDGAVPGADDGGAADVAAEDAAAADAVVAEADATGGGAQADAVVDAVVVAPDAGATVDAAGARDAAPDVAARRDGGDYNLIGDDDGCSYGRGGRGAWWLSGLVLGGFALARRLRRSGRAARRERDAQA